MGRGKGEGAVFKDKRGLWTATVELPADATKLGKDGKPLRRRKVVRSVDKATVLRKLAALRAEVERSGDMPTASQTLESWLTYWIEKVLPKRKIRPNTLDDYRSKVRAQIIPAIGTSRLDKLTPATVRKLHDTMEAHGLSSTYILTTHRVLSKALEDAMRDGRVNRNVAKLVDPPSRSTDAVQPLEVDEAITVLARAATALKADDPYDPMPALWAAYLLTANRRGELLGLEWDRVVLDDADPHIDLSWQLQRIRDISTAAAKYEYRHLTGKLYLTRPKSSAGWRIIPLTDPLASLLRDHQARSAPNPHGLVFARSGGQPWEPGRVSVAWAQWREHVTEKQTRLHDIRHTTVDLLYAAGVPEDIIRDIVGHSTISMTRSYKSRLITDRHRDGMLQLAAMFKPAVG